MKTLHLKASKIYFYYEIGDGYTKKRIQTQSRSFTTSLVWLIIVITVNVNVNVNIHRSFPLKNRLL